MNDSPLRLEREMMTSVVVSAADTASERMYALVGSPIPTVMTRLRHTPLRFSLTAQPKRKIRVAA